jgi:hypothetical protein
VPDCRTRDSAGSASLPLSAARFSAKNRGFLTHSRLDATYTERAKRHFAKSRIEQSIAAAPSAGCERRAQQ